MVGTSVATASVEPEGVLRLRWSNNEVVELLDSWKEYESYTIRYGDRVVIV